MSANDIRTAKGAADWFLSDMQALAKAKTAFKGQRKTAPYPTPPIRAQFP
jgi:hypothetical protein